MDTGVIWESTSQCGHFTARCCSRLLFNDPSWLISMLTSVSRGSWCLLLTAFEGGAFAFLVIGAVYPIKAGRASFQIKLNCLQSLAYVGYRANCSSGFGRTAGASLQIAAAVWTAVFHFCRTRRTKSAFVAADPGLAVVIQGLVAAFAFCFHFQRHRRCPSKTEAIVPGQQLGDPAIQDRLRNGGNIPVEPAVRR